MSLKVGDLVRYTSRITSVSLRGSVLLRRGMVGEILDGPERVERPREIPFIRYRVRLETVDRWLREFMIQLV